MKKLLVVLVLISCSTPVFAQRPQSLDSLFQLLDEGKLDTQQMHIHRRIARLYREYNTSKALEYYQKALQLARSLNRPKEVADNYSSLGYCYELAGKLDQSLENYLNAIRTYEEIGEYTNRLSTYLSIISLYAGMNQFEKSHEYVRLSEKMLQGSADSALWSSWYSQCGSLYSQEGKQDSALYFTRRELELVSRLKDTAAMVVCLSNMGLIFKKSGDLQQAESRIRQALTIVEQGSRDEYSLSGLYNNLGSILMAKKDFKQAEIKFLKSLDYANQGELRQIVLENFRNLADLYLAQSNFSKYIVYHQKYDALRDSIFTNETSNRIEQLETDYLLDKKNIDLVKKDAQLQQQRNQRNILLLVVLSMVLGLVSTLIFIRKINQKKNEVEQQNQLISSQKEELSTLNQIKDRLFSIISHDLRHPLNTLQSFLLLSNTKNLPEEKKQKFQQQTSDALAQTSHLLEDLLSWARLQMQRSQPPLLPYAVQDIGTDVVALIVLQAQQKNIQIISSFQEAFVICDLDILSLALRNILTNAIKYSQPGGKIQLSGISSNGKYRIRIIDEGIGMDEAQRQAILNSGTSGSRQGTEGEKGHALGLFLVMQLLPQIHAQMDIESTPGQGSEFTLWLELYEGIH